MRALFRESALTRCFLSITVELTGRLFLSEMNCYVKKCMLLYTILWNILCGLVSREVFLCRGGISFSFDVLWHQKC